MSHRKRIPTGKNKVGVVFQRLQYIPNHPSYCENGFENINCSVYGHYYKLKRLSHFYVRDGKKTPKEKIQEFDNWLRLWNVLF